MPALARKTRRRDSASSPKRSSLSGAPPAGPGRVGTGGAPVASARAQSSPAPACLFQPRPRPAARGPLRCDACLHRLLPASAPVQPRLPPRARSPWGGKRFPRRPRSSPACPPPPDGGPSGPQAPQKLEKTEEVPQMLPTPKAGLAWGCLPFGHGQGNGREQGKCLRCPLGA